ncbi:MAG: glycoside hydrolase family 30 beta sandwich domain-containing protein [Aquabacterium sp.]|nr:glycoside hydrolase family 30 beta sandwich domain-containing protein [Aquabacterium sp.]
MMRKLLNTRTALALVLSAALAGCGSGALAPTPDTTIAPASMVGTAGPAVDSWTTTGDKSRRLAHEAGLAFGNGPALPVHIDVDATQRFQTMVGFGASLTDASAWLIQHRMSEAQRRELLQELFGRGPNGVGFDFTRLTIGASDFSRSHYSFNDRPAGQTDLPLAHFSIAPNRAEVLPVLKQALAINPGLQVMASPWSAPGWMKSNGSLIQGTLKPEYFDAFSRYLLRYVDAYAAEGVAIFALTLQNEPHFEPGDYPGMRLDPPARAAIIGQHLGPMLAQRGSKVQLIEWDHNWDVPQAPLAVLADPVARPFVAGVGWHCYAGQVAAQTLVHDAYPDKDAWFTECSGGEWKPHWPETLPWMMRNLVIGATRGWAKGVLMWNLALDERHGPHLGGCPDCRGVVTIDSVTGAVTRNLEYYALAHASKFVRPGAQRIASTAASAALESVAFRNADDGSLVLVVCNSGATEQRFSVRSGAQVLQATLARESVATYVWRP